MSGLGGRLQEGSLIAIWLTEEPIGILVKRVGQRGGRPGRFYCISQYLNCTNSKLLMVAFGNLFMYLYSQFGLQEFFFFADDL